MGDPGLGQSPPHNQSEAVITSTQCPNCGGAIAEGSNYCSGCGTLVERKDVTIGQTGSISTDVQAISPTTNPRRVKGYHFNLFKKFTKLLYATFIFLTILSSLTVLLTSNPVLPPIDGVYIGVMMIIYLVYYLVLTSIFAGYLTLLIHLWDHDDGFILKVIAIALGGVLFIGIGLLLRYIVEIGWDRISKKSPISVGKM